MSFTLIEVKNRILHVCTCSEMGVSRVKYPTAKGPLSLSLSCLAISNVFYHHFRLHQQAQGKLIDCIR